MCTNMTNYEYRLPRPYVNSSSAQLKDMLVEVSFYVQYSFVFHRIAREMYENAKLKT